MTEEEKEAYRVTVTFPKKDAEWMQKQIDEGEYTSIAEVVRECVRSVRTGGRREGIRIPTGIPGQEVIIPTEVAMEHPDVVSSITDRIEDLSAFVPMLRRKKKKEKEEGS